MLAVQLFSSLTPKSKIKATNKTHGPYMLRRLSTTSIVSVISSHTVIPKISQDFAVDFPVPNMVYEAVEPVSIPEGSRCGLTRSV